MDITIHLPNPSSIIVWVLAFVAVVNLALAWRTWVSNRRNPINIYFALAILMAAGWASALLGYWATTTPYTISWFIRLSYGAGTLIVVFFYLFTFYFPYNTTAKPRSSLLLVLLASTLFVLFFSILPNVFVPSAILPENKFRPGHNMLWGILYTMHFVSVVLLAYRNLYLKYKFADGIWRQRIRQIILATTVAFLGGGILALAIPVFFNFYKLDWVGSLFTLFMAAYIWYHIFWVPNRVPKVS